MDHLEHVTSLSSRLTFQRMRANDPWKVSPLHISLEQYFRNLPRAIEWVSTIGWSERAVPQLTVDTAVRATHHFQMSTSTKWAMFCMELIASNNQFNTFDQVKHKWEELILKN